MALRQLSPYCCRLALLAFALVQLSPAGIFACQSAGGDLHFGCGCNACEDEAVPAHQAAVPAVCCEHCQQAAPAAVNHGPCWHAVDRCCEHQSVHYAAGRTVQPDSPAVAALPVAVLTLAAATSTQHFNAVPHCANAPPGLSPPALGACILPLRI